jgi:hypothetical protein
MGMAKVLPRSPGKRRSSRPTSARRVRSRPSRGSIFSDKARRGRRKFLRLFPGGFGDETYLNWERGYKWQAHRQWRARLGKPIFRKLIEEKRFQEIAKAALQIESRTNLLFSFEKMALRDAVRSPQGAKAFALALFDFLHGAGPLPWRFEAWIEAVARLPRRKRRVLTWPTVTVFGFIAQPRTHFFLKPVVTKEAARRYGTELPYAPRPSWPLYRGILDFVGRVRIDIRNLNPRDMIDMQSFLWVQGSDEYPD